jgi:hypothetical protein
MLSRADAALVDREPALPGLALVLDADAFAEMLRQRLPRADICDATATYVRYKPGTSCLVAYRVRTGSGEIDIYAKAFRDGNSDKLQAAERLTAMHGPLHVPGFALHDRFVAVYRFPYDRSLRALHHLADDHARAALLQRLIPTQSVFQTAAIERLRYKPERRFVAKLTASDGSEALLKIYTAADYRVARTGATAYESRNTLWLPSCIGADDRHHAMMFAWVSGQPLLAAIGDGETRKHAFHTVGAALADLHSQTPQGLTAYDREAELAALHATAESVGSLSPRLASHARFLARHLSDEIRHLPVAHCPTHGDFKADQVLLSPWSVTLLDLDQARIGDPASDLGSFAAHLFRQSVAGLLPATELDDLTLALLQGYLSGPGSDAGNGSSARPCLYTPRPIRLGLYTAAGLLRLAAEPFRFREPDWDRRMSAIIEHALDVATRDEVYA